MPSVYKKFIIRILYWALRFSIFSSMICVSLLKTLQVHHFNMNFVREQLYSDFQLLYTWFYDNYMFFNPRKSNFMGSGLNISVDKLFIYRNFKLNGTSKNEIFAAQKM